METMYEISEISRQGYYTQRERIKKIEFMDARTLEIIKEVRADHPKMGARTMFHKLNIDTMGINKFEQFVSASGLGIQRKRLWIKTTYSNHNLYKYPNLTNGLALTGINQLWVSDITYFITLNGTFYIVLIQDVYSRRILGYYVSDNMYMVNNIKALKMAFKTRSCTCFENLIHHSDKGSQYCSNAYIRCLLKANCKISMANNSLENPYAERLNGIIKNDYLVFENINSLSQLVLSLSRVINKYNNERPHTELNYRTPLEYEKSLINCQNPQIMILYDFKKNKDGF